MTARYWLGIGYLTNLILDFEPLSVSEMNATMNTLQQAMKPTSRDYQTIDLD